MGSRAAQVAGLLTANHLHSPEYTLIYHYSQRQPASPRPLCYGSQTPAASLLDCHKQQGLGGTASNPRIAWGCSTRHWHMQLTLAGTSRHWTTTWLVTGGRCAYLPECIAPAAFEKRLHSALATLTDIHIAAIRQRGQLGSIASALLCLASNGCQPLSRQDSSSGRLVSCRLVWHAFGLDGHRWAAWTQSVLGCAGVFGRPAAVRAPARVSLTIT